MLVLTLRKELERVYAVLEGEAVRDKLFDGRKLAGRQERERLWVRVCVSEGSEDVDFARCGGGDGESDVARAHTDQKDLTTSNACLFEEKRE